MESNTDLDAIERARLAPFAASAADPIWIWPIIGLLVFVQVAAWDLEPVAIPIAVLVLYCVGLGGLVAYMARRRGVQPTLRVGEMPGSLRRELYVFWAVSTGVAGATVLIQATSTFAIAGLFAGLSITVLGMWYHRRYQDRVEDLVDRL